MGWPDELQYVKDSNGNVVGLSNGSIEIKLSSNLVNIYTKYWMPYAGTWATDGTPVATGTVATGHLYAVGDKLAVPPYGGGTILSTGTVIPEGIYTITASATPNFSCTRDSAPGVNLTAGTGTFDGTTQTEVFRYTLPGGLMGLSDHIKGSFIAYYGAGSTSSKRVRVIAGGAATLVNFDVATAGVAMGETGFSFRNIGSLSSQLFTQTYATGLAGTTFGSAGGVSTINTANNCIITWTLQKTTGADALALWATRLDLERI
jgi:hypothetical protein